MRDVTVTVRLFVPADVTDQEVAHGVRDALYSCGYTPLSNSFLGRVEVTDADPPRWLRLWRWLTEGGGLPC